MIAPTVRRSLRGRRDNRDQPGEPTAGSAIASSVSRTNIMVRPDGSPGAAAPITAASRESMIREAAYLRAERRGFAPGAELEDWFAAEREVDDHLSAG